MIKKTYKIFLIIFLLIIFITPFFSFAAGLVSCTTNCQFNDLMKLVNDVINYVFLVLAVPIAAIMFAYAGILMVTSAGSKESREKAKSIFFNVTLGLFFIGACWLLVHLVFNIVGYKDASWIGL